MLEEVRNIGTLIAAQNAGDAQSSAFYSLFTPGWAAAAFCVFVIVGICVLIGIVDFLTDNNPVSTEEYYNPHIESFDKHIDTKKKDKK